VGLGLSIVKRVAALHRARVTFAPAGERGLRASVEFPRVT
jgi:signal transduction histidine kinase